MPVFIKRDNGPATSSAPSTISYVDISSYPELFFLFNFFKMPNTYLSETFLSSKLDLISFVNQGGQSMSASDVQVR